MSDTTILSDAQLEANRANALKSTGPRTPEGKSRSRNNSFKHGLTGRKVYVPEGQEDVYNQFVSGIIGSLFPANPLELQLCRDVADAHWRLSRIKSIEDAMYAYAEPGADPDLPAHPEHATAILLAQGRLFLNSSGSFTNITLYESRIQRGIKNAMEELRRLQAERRDRVRRHMEDALQLHKHQIMLDADYEPADHGFDFSFDEVDRALARERLEIRAKYSASVGYDLAKYQQRYPPKAA